MFAQRDWGFGAWAAACGPGFMNFGRPGGPRRRMFKRGDLKYVILRYLSDEPMHGYEIIRRLEEESGGTYTPSPGSIYPTLQMLEDQGLVSSVKEDGRKTYEITAEGRGFLAEHNRKTEDILDRFANLGERFSGNEMRDVTRSFVRLAQVSFDRAMGASADPELMASLKEILDRATQDIETATAASAGGASSGG